jgi:uncharacterized protein DUF4350
MPDDGRVDQRGYALPYYTRLGSDTEYLISNPGVMTITGSLVVYGPECVLVGEPVRIKVGPHCTQSVRIRAIVAEHAGHAFLATNQLPVIAIHYMRKDLAVVGSALAGSDALARWPPKTRSLAYGFGYRTLPLGPDTLDGSLFVSNPNTISLNGILQLFDERCEEALAEKFSIRPGCTQEFRFPPKHYGYGQVTISAPAVLNLLHFAKSAGGLTAAELIGAANQVQTPPPPGSGLLIDYTHDCRSPATGDLIKWEAALVATGAKIDRLLSAPITAATLQPYRALVIVGPRIGYGSSEVQAISDFVQAGGGLLIVGDYGVDPSIITMPWTWPTRSVMGGFGVIDDNNMAEDAQHNDGGPGNVIFEASRCFKPHPIVTGLSAISVSAVCTYSLATGWTTVIATDSDAVPANQPVLIERSFGAGRVLIFGDCNSATDTEIAKYDNQTFALRCADRVLFKI